MENPHVTMLGHLTGRLLLSRDGYAVDVTPRSSTPPRATGTIIELNANPRRLDMDWRWWPLAKEKGVKCAINPDAHHTSQSAVPAFRHRHRAQRLAHARRRGELPAARQDRGGARGETRPQQMIWLVVAAIVIASYLLGSIPSGLLISKSQGIDIREHGSRNIGATNVWRVMGKKWGLLAFFCDTAKGWLAVHARRRASPRAGRHDVPLPPRPHRGAIFSRRDFAGITAALGCILGHNFPVWLRFKGGKGVATSLGVIIGMMPLAALIIFAVWGVVLKLSRYVSLASLVAAVCAARRGHRADVLRAGEGWAAVHGWGNFYFAVAAALLVIKRHTPNIQRLLAGTELRFGDAEARHAEQPRPIRPEP